VAGDRALITSEAEYFSLQGVEQALEVVELAKDSLNPDLEWLGVVLNIADMRLVHAREALKTLQERFGEKVFESVIRRSVAYAESAERGVSIVDRRPDLAADYLDLAEEVLDRLELGEQRTAVAQLR
jgi:chromosome partitioning protein